MAKLESETESSQSESHPVKPVTSMWVGLLVVYVALFVSTGYLAFVNIELLPPIEKFQELIGLEDADVRAFMLEAMKAEDSERALRMSLATQSFNVVLGALLGFLSASAASVVTRQGDG